MPHGSGLFDFRRIILRPKVLEAVSEIFYERFKQYPRLQIGGLESAAIPIITACVVKCAERGQKVSGFFVRKSRKKKGVLDVIEGRVDAESPIILVDDLLNRGRSFQKQAEILRERSLKVTTVFSLLRYRDSSYYGYLHENNIGIEEIFTLEDFRESLGAAFLEEKGEIPLPQPFRALWRFESPGAELETVLPKSGIALGENKLYYGGDNGTLWCLRQEDGALVWKYETNFPADKKQIFSTPIVRGGRVYFAGHNGVVHCLDA
ncbi:MAG: PQQ-binding-like beta-propeller repeat protein, partial [bacterium]|nr:PQQ-binding-like beta-propeller repeat protein [bacterium]